MNEDREQLEARAEAAERALAEILESLADVSDEETIAALDWWSGDFDDDPPVKPGEAIDEIRAAARTRRLGEALRTAMQLSGWVWVEEEEA